MKLTLHQECQIYNFEMKFTKTSQLSIRKRNQILLEQIKNALRYNNHVYAVTGEHFLNMLVCPLVVITESGSQSPLLC